MRSALPAIVLAALVVLAGCSGLPVGGDGATPTDGTTATPTATTAGSTTPATDGSTTPGDPADPTGTTTPATSRTTTPPEGDVVGRENGYGVDDPIDVTPEDGFNDSEFAALKARTMARVEVIRDREFRGDANVEFVTREELLADNPFQFRENPYRDLFWEAAFAVGEDRTSAAALNDLYRVVVDGYAGGNRVVIVAENPESPRIDPTVLSHELAHVLGGPEADVDYREATADDRLVIRSVAEGNANFVEAEYDRRCETEWSCIERPPNASEVENFEDVNEVLFLWFAAPYTVGQDLFTDQYDREGIDGVDGIYRNFPASMEQVIHPADYPDDEPADVAVPDRSEGGWERFRNPDNAMETEEFGEAILYATLKANGVLGGPDPEINKAQRTGLNYSHPATEGWDGDAFVPYRDGDDRGYVFVSRWESGADAREFRDAYLALLESKGATEVREGVYRIPGGSFADAFRVTVEGDRVVVVNGPTVEALDEIHPEEE